MKKPEHFPNIFLRGIKLMIIHWGRIYQLHSKKSKRLVVFLSILSVVTSTFPLAVNWANGLFLNRLIANQGTGVLTPVLLAPLLIVALIPFVRNFLGHAEGYWQRKVNDSFKLEASEVTYRKIGSTDVDFLENVSKRNLLDKVVWNGSRRLGDFFWRWINVFGELASIAGAVLSLSLYYWWLFATVAVFSLPGLLNELRYGRSIWGVFDETAELRRKQNDILGQFIDIDAFVNLKIFQNVRYFSGLARDIADQIIGKEFAIFAKKVIADIKTFVLSQGVFVFGYFFLSFKVIQGSLEVGTFTFLVATLTMLRSSLRNVFQAMARQYEDDLFVKEYFEFLDAKNVVVESATPVKLFAIRAPEIVLDHVSFAYPGTNRLVLRDINLTIPSGERLALVGANGAGKTTLVKLLCRLYDPTQGRILVGGGFVRVVSGFLVLDAVRFASGFRQVPFSGKRNNWSWPDERARFARGGCAGSQKKRSAQFYYGLGRSV